MIITAETFVTFRTPWLARHAAALAKLGHPTTLHEGMLGMVEEVLTHVEYRGRSRNDRKPLTRVEVTRYRVAWEHPNGGTFTNFLPASAIKIAR